MWDEASFRARLAATPALGIEDYRLAFRGGRLTGLVAAWDAFPMKQVRLLSLTPALATLRAAYNPVARALGRTALPRDGEHLRFVYGSQPCAEEPVDLRALLVHLHAERSGGPHVYVDLSLDVRDPLGGALAGFWRSSVDFDVSLLTWGGADPPRDRRPIYFDVSFV